MKKIWFTLTLITVLLLVLMGMLIVHPVASAADPTATPTALVTPDPDDQAIQVVQSYYDAFNAGKVEEALTWIAEDAMFINPIGTFEGKEAIAGQLEGLAAADFSFELSNFRVTYGRVIYDYVVKQGDAVLETGDNGETVVRGGKVVFDGTVSTEPANIVVMVYYDALNVGDLEVAMRFIAEDALFINPTGKYEGVEQIKASLQGLITDKITFELSNLKIDEDGRVVYDYNVLQGGVKLDSGSDGLTIVKDGLIVFDGTLTTEPQF